MQKEKQSLLQELPWPEIFDWCSDHPHLLPYQLKSLGFDAKTLQSIATPAPKNGEPYSRQIVFKNNFIEVMLASWAEKSISSPHNHGASKGLIWFAKGHFTEQHYAFKQTDLVAKTTPIRYPENTVVCVSQSDIHSCGPDVTGISLHIYSPPIEKMKVWDISNRRMLTVVDECGAWLPSDSRMILSAASW